MKMPYMIILAVFLLSGCATTIAPSLQMSKDTKVYLFDASGDVLFSSSVANDSNAVKAITRRIISDTAERLEKNNVIITKDLTGDAANLKYDIKIISGDQSLVDHGYALIGRNKIGIKYRVTFEEINGKKLFVYEDEQDDSNIDDACDKIASKVTSMVLKYYKE